MARRFDESKVRRHRAGTRVGDESVGGRFANKQTLTAMAFSTTWAERISGMAGRARAGRSRREDTHLAGGSSTPSWLQSVASHMDREGRAAEAIHAALGRGERAEAPPPPIEILMDRLAKLPSVNLSNLQVRGRENRNLFTSHIREIPRSEMPQLPETAEGIAAFLAELDRLGVKYELRPTDPRDLVATQNELDSVKVAKLYHAIHDPSGGWRPESIFFASREGAVLDGHHRWGGASMAIAVGDHFTPNVMWIDMPIDDLLVLADRFSGEKVSMSAGFRS
jgi:hypothetical protein